MNIEGLTCEKIKEMEYLILNEYVDVLVPGFPQVLEFLKSP